MNIDANLSKCPVEAVPVCWGGIFFLYVIVGGICAGVAGGWGLWGDWGWAVLMSWWIGVVGELGLGEGDWSYNCLQNIFCIYFVSQR